MRAVGHRASRAILVEPYEIGVTHEWFVMSMRAQAWPIGASAWRTCPVCNDKWRPWAGSRLPCHAKCLWTPVGALALFNDSRNEKQLMTDLGVTISIVRAGKRAGGKLMSLAAEKVTVDGDDPDEMMGDIDRSKRCDELNCALIAGHERELTCRMRSSAVLHGELLWLWHEPGCSLDTDHKDECTWNGHPTCGIGRVRVACRRLYGHDGACSP